MKRGTLGISWLNESVTAAWVTDEGEPQLWRAPDLVTDRASLSQAVAEACRRGGDDARRVVFLVDHRNLLFHVQETPPAKGRLLDQMLGRLVEESRFFDEPAVWAKLMLPAGPKHHRWLLALMPRPVWTDVQAVCDENDLDLVGIYPATAVLVEYLGKVGAAATEAVLLVASFGGAHGFLVGRGDGQVLFARSIASTRGEIESRLDQEINRTLQFVHQRFGVQVTRLVAVGPDSHALLSKRKQPDGLRVECLVADYDDPASAAGLGEDGIGLALNFVRRSGWDAAWVRPALAAAMVILLGVSIGTLAWTLSDAAARERDRVRMTRETRAVDQIEATRRDRQREWNRLELLKRALGDPDEPGMAAGFCRYLRSTLPQDLRLTRLSISRSTNVWTLQVEGMSREQGGRFHSSLEQWESVLTGGVFQVKVGDSTYRRSVGTATIESPASFGSGGRSTQVKGPGEERAFFVTGVIQ